VEKLGNLARTARALEDFKKEALKKFYHNADNYDRRCGNDECKTLKSPKKNGKKTASQKMREKQQALNMVFIYIYIHIYINIFIHAYIYI
jgi:hypothetical protein